MMKRALILVVMAACGGGKKAAPAAPAETASAESPAPAGKGEEPARLESETSKAAPVDDSVVAQAALTEQYDTGKKLYTEKKCNTCHGDDGKGNPKNPPVIGDKAYPETALKTAKLRKGIKFETAKDVLGFVKAKMPIKAPGSLSDDEAAAVTSWMLSESKVQIEKKLSGENAGSVKLR